MFEKRLLSLTKDRLILYPWKRGGVSGPTERFEPTKAGREAFAKRMRVNPWIPLYLLVDLVEEEFRVETMPHVLGPDRGAMRQRRLDRAFPVTPLRHLKVQGREKKVGRRDDVTLLSGVIDPGLILPWIEIIREHGLLLAGIYSLPLVSARLLKVLDVVTPATLMVSWQSASGLRFSFFVGEHLKMSRMAPVPGFEPRAYADLFVLELERTRSYLDSLRLIPRETPVQVVLFTSPEMLDVVRPRCEESATFGFQWVTVNQVARKLGIKRRITTPFSDSLFIQLLGRRLLGNHYATPEMTGEYHSRVMKLSLYVAAVLFFMTGLVGGGYELIRGYESRAGWQRDAHEIQQLQAEYLAIQNQKLPTRMDPHDVRQVVEILDRLKGMGGQDPSLAMIAVSRALVGFEDVRITSMVWKGADHPDTRRYMASQVAKGIQRPRQGKRGVVTQGGLDPLERVEMVELIGEVEGMDSTAHGLERVNGWMAALLSDPDVYQIDPILVPKLKEKVEVLKGDLLHMKPEGVALAPFRFHVIYRRKGVDG